MKILLNKTSSNYDKLEKALDEVQKLARVRTTSVNEILTLINNTLFEFEKLGISKKNQKGITFWLDPNAQTFAKSYKGYPQSTLVKVEIQNCPVITNIIRSDCESKLISSICYTEEAKKDIMNKATYGLDIDFRKLKSPTIKDTRYNITKC